MNLLSTLAVQAVGLILRLAGISDEVVSILEEEIAPLTAWVASELEGGNDPQAQLRAMRTSAEVAAKAFENAELGPAKKD